MTAGNGKASADDEEMVENEVHVKMPQPGDTPPPSRRYYPLLRTLAVLTAIAAVVYLITSACSFKVDNTLFFPLTTTIWAALQVLTAIAVLIASFSLWRSVLLSVAAVSIPCVCGDVVVLIFCAIWYPRPIKGIGIGVLTTNAFFILFQLSWLIVACAVARQNEIRADNRANDHHHTTKVFNDPPQANGEL